MKTLTRSAFVALALLAGGCGSNPEDTPDPVSPTKNQEDALTSSPAADDSAYRMTLTNTSWGEIEPPPPEPPHPTVVSEAEGRRQKFLREAHKRWKNTEIFMVGSQR